MNSPTEETTTFELESIEVRKFETIFTLDKANAKGFRHIVFVKNENPAMHAILTAMFASPRHAFTFEAVAADPAYPEDFCRITKITRFRDP
ncbi:MAG: hypothetical protein AAGF59_06200 [Pseudomonadota bacterium]